ncbi:hypothetical protein [Rubrivivax gelatinosus]|uniref:hypothetical protein n=1 Tax=Rubrivivax gelatinosus TaxID=28068 RepID=UPI0012FDEA4A|nr:hypothetical protein [Rubrivivax gelatinosus]MBG6080178.1 hypothetical protein [Rubrivivax gelatinosus]
MSPTNERPAGTYDSNPESSMQTNARLKLAALALPVAAMNGAAFAQTPAAAPDCATMLEQSQRLAGSQSYEQFDQAEDAGFRSLARAGCFVEAAALIEAYAAEQDGHAEILQWHAAQMLAKAGRYEAAVGKARLALLKHDHASFRWNDYVLGTIGFLERDKPALMRHRDRLAAAAAAHPENLANLRVLDRLIERFDKPYAVAISVSP